MNWEQCPRCKAFQAAGRGEAWRACPACETADDAPLPIPPTPGRAPEDQGRRAEPDGVGASARRWALFTEPIVLFPLVAATGGLTLALTALGARAERITPFWSGLFVRAGLLGLFVGVLLTAGQVVSIVRKNRIAQARAQLSARRARCRAAGRCSASSATWTPARAEDRPAGARDPRLPPLPIALGAVDPQPERRGRDDAPGGVERHPP